MTVYSRGSSWVYDFHRDGVRHKRAGFRSAEEARDAEIVARGRLIDQRLAREYGIRPARAKIPSLREYIETTYLPEIKARLAPITFRHHRVILLRLADHFGAYRISDVTPEMMTRFRNTRAGALKANSLREEFVRLRQFFRRPLEDGYLTTNPAAGVGLPRGTRGPDRILTEDEQERFLAGFWTGVMRDMAEFSLWTALRPGELCGLTGSMVDLKGARLLMPQPKVERPKVIPLTAEAVAILLRQPKFGPDDPVFRGALRGKAVRLNVYSKAYRSAVASSGIPPIRPNDLRHTVAVRILRAGSDIPTVGDILGHKPPYHTTLRYVAHVNEERKREVLGRLASPPKSTPKKKSARRTPVQSAT